MKPPAPEQVVTFARHRSLGYQVNHLARLLARSIRARIEPLGVVPGQFAQLLALYEEDGLTQAELCDRVRIDQSTMAHTLKRMERDGLVSRTRDAADRRRSRVYLAPRALDIQGSLVSAAGQVNALALQGVPSQEHERLLDTLAHLIANLEADPATDPRSDREER